MTLALSLAAAVAAPLATVGETLGGVEVTAVEAHPEYHAITVALDDGRPLRIELVASGEGVCSRDGLQIFPRWELLGEQSPELEDEHHPAVGALCARLDAAELPALAPPGGSGGGGERGPTPDACTGAEGGTLPPPAMPGGGWGWAVLTAVGLGAARELVGTERGGRRWMGALAGLHLVLVALGGCGLANGALAGFEKLRLAWGIADNELYGVGLTALHHPIVSLLGRSVEAVFSTHAALAALGVALLFGLVDSLAGRRAAVLAGLAWALLPLNVRLACSEVGQVPVTTLQILALCGFARFVREERGSGVLTAALASACVVHLRPEAATFLAVVPAWVVLLGVPRWRPVVVGALLAAPLALSRVLELAARASQLEDVTGDSGRAQALLEALVPSLAVDGRFPFVFSTFEWTPALLMLGLVVAPMGLLGKRPSVVPALAVWAAVVWAPVMTKTTPLMDMLRFQLPVGAALCAVAGVGLAMLARGPMAIPLTGLLLVGGLWRAPVAHERFLHQAEARWLLSELELPDDAGTIFFDPTPIRARAFGLVMSVASDATWRPLCSEPSDEVVFYEGLSCLAELNPPTPASRPVCAELREACTMVPLSSRSFEELPDVDLDLRPPNSLRLSRLRCGS